MILMDSIVHLKIINLSTNENINIIEVFAYENQKKIIIIDNMLFLIYINGGLL